MSQGDAQDHVLQVGDFVWTAMARSCFHGSRTMPVHDYVSAKTQCCYTKDEVEETNLPSADSSKKRSYTQTEIS